MKRVVVAGGGIAGLAAAYRLLRLREAGGLDAEVLLLEACERVGGKIKTDRSAGFVVEAGPDSFLTIKPEAEALARELGLGERLLPTAPGERDVYVYARGRLRRLPEGLMLMAPSRAWPFLRSDLMSWRGKLRTGLERFVPRGGRRDESLAEFALRRLGREALDTIVDPLMAGIYAGDARELSIESTFPQFVEMERRYGSVIRGLRAGARGRTAPAGALTAFASLKGGLEELVDALRTRLGPTVLRTGARVRAVRRAAKGFAVDTDAQTLAADAVVVALPGADAAGVLRELDEELSRTLLDIPAVSTATVTLGFEAATAPRLPKGYGFVAPKTSGLMINAATFTSQKFPQRAYPSAVIRCFIGGTSKEHLIQVPDADILGGALADLKQVLGITSTPTVARIFRWIKANPQYTVGHGQRIKRIEARLDQWQGLVLAGGSYYGVGIPDCIRSGDRAAEEISKYLKG